MNPLPYHDSDAAIPSKKPRQLRPTLTAQISIQQPQADALPEAVEASPPAEEVAVAVRTIHIRSIIPHHY